jgi:hypothetical protein
MDFRTGRFAFYENLNGTALPCPIKPLILIINPKGPPIAIYRSASDA